VLLTEHCQALHNLQQEQRMSGSSHKELLWSLFHITSAKDTNLKLLRFHSPLLSQSRLPRKELSAIGASIAETQLDAIVFSGQNTFSCDGNSALF
jgi:hypothetical protein